MAKRGPKSAPNEVKRRRGNPGKRALPDEAEVIALEPAAAAGPPPPLRQLGAAGQAAWEAAWRDAAYWLAASDTPRVQAYAETVDDYTMLRVEMIARLRDDPEQPGLWRVRKQVLDLRKQLNDSADALGLSPTSRALLGVAEVRVQEGLDRLRSAPRSRRKTTVT